MGAGSDTVANTLAMTTFHLLDNPDKLAKLVEELERAMPDPEKPARLTVVEKLPYLVGNASDFLRIKADKQNGRRYPRGVEVCTSIR